MAKAISSLAWPSIGRRHLLACVTFLAFLLPADRIYDRSLDKRSASAIITEITRADGFGLVEWEAKAIALGMTRRARADMALRTASSRERQSVISDYFVAVADVQRLRQEMDEPVGLDARSQLGQRLRETQARQESMADLAGAAIAMQVTEYLAEQGISTDLVRVVLNLRFPPLSLEIGAPVFFSFTELPLLLVVAPRDRIAVSSTSFLRADLSTEESERIERSVDAAGAVSSVVLPIGGFAAYPSMVPVETSQRAALQTIAHEWVHHYLALKPLGWRYFDDYSARSLNETVADIAGREIASAILQRNDMTGLQANAGSTARSRDFSAAMSEIRRAVEAMLASGDVDGAEQYMAEKKEWLASKGYRLRKLNTAYLTFYGAYSNTGNRVEPKLALLRERSGSLGAFLRASSAITSERDLDGLLVK